MPFNSFGYLTFMKRIFLKCEKLMLHSWFQGFLKDYLNLLTFCFLKSTTVGKFSNCQYWILYEFAIVRKLLSRSRNIQKEYFGIQQFTKYSQSKITKKRKEKKTKNKKEKRKNNKKKQILKALLRISEQKIRISSIA